MTNRQAVDRQQRLEIVLQTGNRGRKLTGETVPTRWTWAHAASRFGASRIARTSAMNSGAASSGILKRRLAVRWNQQRMRIEEEPAVTVLGIDDEPGEPLAVHIETKTEHPGSRTRGSFAIVKDRPLVPHACHTRATPSGTKGELRVTGE